MLIITGLPRSGTSAATAAFHRNGWDMGDRFIAPLPGSDAVEFEDARLNTMLAAAFARGEGPNEWFFSVGDYLSHRKDRAARVIRWGWGFKSCFVLPYLNEFKKLADIIEEPVNVIVIDGDLDHTLDSYNRYFQHAQQFTVVSEYSIELLHQLAHRNAEWIKERKGTQMASRIMTADQAIELAYACTPGNLPRELTL